MKQLLLVMALFGLAICCFGQTDQYNEFRTSRFARVVGFGNAYTGLADDIETVYYNSSGLANLNYFSAAFSQGQGYAFIHDDYTSYDLAFLLPIFQKIGAFAFSLNRFSYNEFLYDQLIYRLHYARSLFDNFSVGACINYYYFSSQDPQFARINQAGGYFEGNAFDMNVSALYLLPITSIPGIWNETRFGFQIQNLFDSKIRYNNDLNPSSKHQSLRLGLSTKIVPEIPRLLDFDVIGLIIASDAVFYGSEYTFRVFQPNFGIELTFLEILSLRYGRENEIDINARYEYSPQHPVKRYGLGISLPLDKIVSGVSIFRITVDYSYSDWDQLDESKPMMPYLANDLPIREAYSIKVSIQM